MDKDELTYHEELLKAQEIVQKQLKSIQKVNDTLNPAARASIYPMPFSSLVLGNSRAGKSYSVLKQLSNPAYKILERIASGDDIYIISPTWKLDQTMKQII